MKRIGRYGTGVSRVIFVLLSLILVTQLTAQPIAAEQVVGSADAPQYGVDYIPSEGVTDAAHPIHVQVVNKQSRYAVDLTYDTSSLSISLGADLTWDVNDLQYVAGNTANDGQYQNYAIPMTITNYSDMPIRVDGQASVRFPDKGYTLEAPGEKKILGVLNADGSVPPADERKGRQDQVIFYLKVPSVTELVMGLMRDAEKNADGSYTLGSLTVTVRPE